MTGLRWKQDGWKNGVMGPRELQFRTLRHNTLISWIVGKQRWAFVSKAQSAMPEIFKGVLGFGVCCINFCAECFVLGELDRRTLAWNWPIVVCSIWQLLSQSRDRTKAKPLRPLVQSHKAPNLNILN